jgi:hypothetical protein
MAGAPAGPALDPERPADRLDAVCETNESRPVRRARRAQPPAGSAPPPGASPPRPRCSPETPGSNLRATAVARTPQLDRRPAVLAEDNERCWSSRAALACVVARRSMFGGSLGAHRARGRRTGAAPLTITSSDRPSKREVEPAREKRERLPRASARIRCRTRSSSGRSSPSCRDRAAGPSARPERAPSWTIANRCRRVAGRRST